MTVSINGTEAGRYEITAFAGYVSFAARKGSIQLRSIYPQTIPTAPDHGPVYPVTDGSITSPQLVREVKPAYTLEAMQQMIEGIIELEAIVERDGRVGHIRIVRGVDPGLDRNAIDAVRQWRFKPGSRGGHPVPILVSVELTMKIK